MEDNQNIEKFFKDKYNQPLKAEPWNTPDDSVWNHISDTLDNDRSKSRTFPVRYFLIGFLLASLFLSSWYNLSQFNRIEDLQQKIAACQKTGESMSGKMKEKVAPITSFQETNVPENHPAQNKINPLPGKINSIAVDEDEVSPGQIVNSETLYKEIEHVSGILPVETGLLAEEKTLTANNGVAQPALLLNPLLNLEKSPGILAVQKPSSVKKRRNSFLGLTLGSVLWLDQEKGAIINPLSELLVEEKTFVSSVAGLQFVQQFAGKWAVNVGLEYARRTQHSVYSIALPYSTDTEIEAGSHFENHFQHSLPTGLGNVNTFLVLARSRDSQLSNNEMVSLELAINQRASVVGLPAGITFFPAGVGRGPFFSSGIRTELVVHTDVDDINLRSHHPLVQENHLNVDYNNLQMNKLNLSFTLGAGYQWPLWRDYHLSGIIQYGHALNPVFRSENYIHDIHSLSAQLVLSKKL